MGWEGWRKSGRKEEMREGRKEGREGERRLEGAEIEEGGHKVERQRMTASRSSRGVTGNMRIQMKR